ncbi:hypothetical protein C4B68_32780 [Streptomyces dengpaensis]|uniref:Mutator family transposase n=1 Tax=Streptomyces dengpaensis TaxID=2049881 RepID=A0ABM6SYL3_9ACTN|nr:MULTISPECIES: transposase [Streptomyces]AVH59745.1 hypothetical protein C4B68_32780 [Streptomyces dengpaensis]PIB09387.1 hypothetical protein B1C81_09460 [Streptomyces sp. HG99]
MVPGAVTVRVPRDRLGTFRPRLLPSYARRTGALDDMVISLTAKGLTSGEIVSHLAQTYGMTTTKETIATITDSRSGTRVPCGRDPITD